MLCLKTSIPAKNFLWLSLVRRRMTCINAFYIQQRPSFHTSILSWLALQTSNNMAVTCTAKYYSKRNCCLRECSGWSGGVRSIRWSFLGWIWVSAVFGEKVWGVRESRFCPSRMSLRCMKRKIKIADTYNFIMNIYSFYESMNIAFNSSNLSQKGSILLFCVRSVPAWCDVDSTKSWLGSRVRESECIQPICHD